MVMENLEVSSGLSLQWIPLLTGLGDLFDEADFVVSTTGNPDEVTLDADALKKQTPESASNQPLPQHHARSYAPPVTPARPNAPVLPPQPQTKVPQNPTPDFPRRPNPTTTQNTSAVSPVQVRSSPQAGVVAQLPNNPNSNIPAASPQQNQQQPPSGGVTPGAFFSAKVVREMPTNTAAPPLFDPHAESPSIPRTPGFDHSKSTPIKKPMLPSGMPPVANNNSHSNSQSRDFVNPSMDMHRKIGVPGGANSAGMFNNNNNNRGPTSTSSYRPLTRPSMGAGGVKRPPLGDVTNANTNPERNHDGDPKRQRTDYGVADGIVHGPQK